MHNSKLFSLFLVVMGIIAGIFISTIYYACCIAKDNNLQAMATLLVGLVATITSIYFGITNKRNTEQQTYQRLELASIELFRFEANNSSTCSLLWCDKGVKLQNLKTKTQIELIAYITQLLNLFEMAIKYRSQKIFPADAFASWLPWIFETCNFKTFRINWESEFKSHYTDDLVSIIDNAIECIEESGSESQDLIQEQFYKRVAEDFNNDMTIKNWKKRNAHSGHY